VAGQRVALVGATGLVGRLTLSILEERRFPIDRLRLFASPRSVGKRVRFQGDEHTIEQVGDDAFDGADLVFLSVETPLARQLAPRAVAAGALVIDDSSAYRLEAGIPLVVPEVNGDDIGLHRGIIAGPNCCTAALVMALAPLQRASPIERVVVDTYQAVSGTGQAALDELHAQERDVQSGERLQPNVYPHPIARNLFPHVDSFREDGYTKEEWKMIQETRKILHLPELRMSATCVRVPVPVGHSEAVHLELDRPMSPAEAREVLSAAPGVRVVDDPEHNVYPMPQDAAGIDDVLVGRIRADLSHPRGLVLWVVGDNLRKGAALNAVQIAEMAVQRSALKVESGEPVLR
jgi:aspartate-semialdehyde dehydrogenase